MGMTRETGFFQQRKTAIRSDRGLVGQVESEDFAVFSRFAFENSEDVPLPAAVHGDGCYETRLGTLQ